jgi:uncharacterized protein DUF5654
MSDYPQYPNMPGGDVPPPGSQGSAPQRRMMGGIDPRRAIDPATVERMIRAQVAARTQAQAATTVVLATIVSLITSAFSFVAALAWNTAIQQLLTENVKVNKGPSIFGVSISEGGVQAIYAVIVTIIAVIVVVILNRIARRYASKSALSNGN